MADEHVGTGLICMECFGEATIQFVNEYGHPCGTLCADCDAAYQPLRDKVQRMLEDAITSLSL